MMIAEQKFLMRNSSLLPQLFGKSESLSLILFLMQNRWSICSKTIHILKRICRVHGITKYQIRKMNNGSIRYSSIAILLFTVLLSSCLKETAIPVSSSFSIEVAEDKTAPVIIKLQNDSYGADEYEWIFEGGSPSY